ncbi:hypothetical protein GCM10027594_09970 [Hymenobacter agri]
MLWPADGGERALALLLLALMLAYGAGFGLLLNHADALEESADFLPKMLVGLNAAWLSSTLLVDFLPALRPVARVVPEHFPVSARWNVAAAFLLDLITLRRILVMAVLLMALAVAPRHAAVPGFSLLLVLGATVFSFNLRLLVALRRWRQPLMLAHLASLALMIWWLTHPDAPYATPLGVGMAVLPWLLGAGQLYWLGPYFSTRYLPDEAWRRGLQNALEGVQVNEWSGDTLRLTFDRYVSRRLPLALPPDSARRYRATFAPAVVTFHGPSSLVHALPNPYPVAVPVPDKDGNAELALLAPARMRASATTVRVHVTRR